MPGGGRAGDGANHGRGACAVAHRDGGAEKPRHNMEVAIRGNHILEVRPANSQALPATAQVIDLGAATLLPGLIDTHTHIFLQGEDPAAGGYDVQLLKFPASYRVVRAALSARRALEQGFTSIRDVETEGAGYGDVGIKQAINEGLIPGPRMWVSTVSISSTGGYPLEGYAPEITVPKGSQLIDGPVEARKAAREQLDKGADWIKVYMTHRSWLDAQGALVSQPTLTVEELKAIVDETHGWGRKVACHAYNGTGITWQRARRRLRFDRARAAARDHGRTDCANAQAGYVVRADPRGVLHRLGSRRHRGGEARSQARGAAHGVSFYRARCTPASRWRSAPMWAASNGPSRLPKSYTREVICGMTPMQAIQSATTRAAELLGKRGELGVVAPGAYADLIGGAERSSGGRQCPGRPCSS